MLQVLTLLLLEPMLNTALVQLLSEPLLGAANEDLLLLQNGALQVLCGLLEAEEKLTGYELLLCNLLEELDDLDVR